jgi:hypothetical protein
MCSNFHLVAQMLHALGMALTVAGLGLVALVLDRYAAKLLTLGATQDTVAAVRHAAAWLLRLDLLLVLTTGAVHMVRVVGCLVGL